MRKPHLLFPVLLLLLLSGLAGAQPLVVASIKPLALFASDYFGKAAEVRTLLLPSQNPHQVNFTPQQVALLHRADLVLWLGADAEPYLAPYLADGRLPALALLAQPGVKALREAETTQAGAIDPHLWLDPLRLTALLPALSKASSDGNWLASPQKNMEAVEKTLNSLVQKRRLDFAPFQSTPWLSYHDPWQYLQNTLHLKPALRVEEHPGAETSSRHFLTLAQTMRAERVKCAVLEPEARKAVMDKLCRAPLCQQVAIDPLARDSESAGYAQWWETMTGRLAQCLANR